MKRSNFEWLSIILIISSITLSTSVMLINSLSTGLWLDEANSVLIASQQLSKIYEYLIAEVNAPLYYYLLHFWIRFLGDADYTVRLFSVLFGIIDIILFGYVSWKIFQDKKRATIAFLLIALSPFFVHNFVEARMYSILVFFEIINIYSFWVCYSSRKKPTWLFVTSSILGLITHHSFTLVLLSEVLFLTTAMFLGDKEEKAESQNQTYWLKTFVVLFVLYLPFLFLFSIKQLHMIFGTGLEYLDFWIKSDIFSYFLGQIGQYLTLNYLVGGKITSSLAIAICIILICPLFLKNKKGANKLDIFLVTLILVPNVILYLKIKNPTLARYSIVSALALYLLVSKNLSLSKGYHYILISILIFSLVFSSFKYTSAWRFGNIEYSQREYAKYVENNDREGDAILIIPAYYKFVYQRYYKGPAEYIDFAPSFETGCTLSNLTLEKTAGSLSSFNSENIGEVAGCLRNYSRIWLIYKDTYSYDNNPFYEILISNFPKAELIRITEINPGYKFGSFIPPGVIWLFER